MFMTLYARTHSPAKKIPGGSTDSRQPLYHCVSSYAGNLSSLIPMAMAAKPDERRTQNQHIITIC